MVHVASSWRSRENETEDGHFDGIGCGTGKVRPKYPSLALISFSAWMSILVFWLDL
jgi:hypothetical protein